MFNPIFLLIIGVLAVLLWVLLSFLYKPIGKIFYRLWEDSAKEIKDIEDNEENKES